MNTERHIRRLNRMLAAELGSPQYAWIYSESPEFHRAMRKTDEFGKPEMDFRCPCGLNVQVHSPECLAGMLVVAEPKWEIRKTNIFLIDQWVLCCLQLPPSEDAWVEMFGSRLPYPKNGTWAPVETETYTVAMPADALPGENFTMALIRARQKSREIHPSDLANAYENREQLRDKRRFVSARDRIKDVLPFNPDPGKRGGSVSWGGVRDTSEPLPVKVVQGENLVSL
jgi:hypothetical protein